MMFYINEVSVIYIVSMEAMRVEITFLPLSRQLLDRFGSNSVYR